MNNIDHKHISGIGQFHTNEVDPNKPEKKLTAYLEIDLKGIRALVDNPQKVDKSKAQWFIPSVLKSRSFIEQETNGEYWMLWADLDTDPKPLCEVNTFIGKLISDNNYEVYASRSARKDYQKGRVIIPLNQPLKFDDWNICQFILNENLNAAGFMTDSANLRAAQLCYLPNQGEFYESHTQREGLMFNPMLAWSAEIETNRQAQIAKVEELKALSNAVKAKREALSPGDMADTIGTFNNAYSVQELLIQHGYTQRGNTFRHPNSESGSYSASVRDNRVHALSSADPLYTNHDGAHDAFSVFAVLDHQNDIKAALKDAGDNWLTINGQSYNKVKQQEYMQSKALAYPKDCTSYSHADNESNNIHVLARYIDFDVDNHKPQEFILDNKIQAGIILLAGGHGCGKTTQLVPLLCRVAHLCVDDELKPSLRRKIIYVTEDSNQVERILHSMWLSDDFADHISKDDIKNMFRVVEAKRMDAKNIVTVADEYLKETIINYNDKTEMKHDTKPLVVIDTINACIEIDNDNDNSEVGEIIAAFKQEFKGLPVLLIAHLAKGLLRSEVENLTARGAGAWEADAHQVLYLVKEQNGTRWLEIGYPKHRFHADADGINFEGITNEIDTTDLLGNPKKEKLIHGKPRVISVGGKKVIKDQEAERKMEREKQQFSEKIYKETKILLDELNIKENMVIQDNTHTTLSTASDNDTCDKEQTIMGEVNDEAKGDIAPLRKAYVSRNEICDEVRANKTNVLEIIKRLVKLGVLIEVEISKENRRDKNQKTGIMLPEIEILHWDINYKTA